MHFKKITLTLKKKSIKEYHTNLKDRLRMHKDKIKCRVEIMKLLQASWNIKEFMDHLRCCVKVVVDYKVTALRLDKLMAVVVGF